MPVSFRKLHLNQAERPRRRWPVVVLTVVGLTAATTGVALATGYGPGGHSASGGTSTVELAGARSSTPRVTPTSPSRHTRKHKRHHLPRHTATSTSAAPSVTPTTPTSAPTTSAPPPASGGGNYSCVQTSDQGKCNYPANSAITGANGDPYLNQNIWAGDKSYKQTLYGASPTDWYVTANANTNFGGVLSYPNVGWNMSGTVDSKATTTSTFSTVVPHDPKVAAWAAYDLWFNNWEDEVMIQTDLAVNSYYDCDAKATATFSGKPWHLCVFGSEKVWKPGTDDQHMQNMTSGSIDVKAMLVWMEGHGYLPKSSTWTAASFGFEVCDTGGVDQKFWVNGLTWNSK